MSSPLQQASSFDITSIQLDNFTKDVLIPLPHVLSHMPDSFKYEHSSKSIQKEDSLLSIFTHNDECFRSFVLPGEILPVVILLKPRAKSGITSEQLTFFAENASIEIYFRKKDKVSGLPIIVPTFAPFSISNSYAETPRLSEREVQSLFLMRPRTLHSYTYHKETHTLLLFTQIPIHMSSELIDEKLSIDVNIKCESQLSQAKGLSDLFLKSEDKYLSFLLSEKDLYYKPTLNETKIQKNVVFMNPLIVSHKHYQRGDLDFIQISIKHNSQLENLIDSATERKNDILRIQCKLSEEVKRDDQSFVINQVDFVLNKSYSNFTAEKQIFLMQKSADEQIKVLPFSEHSIGIQINKLNNESSNELEQNQILIKCKNCASLKPKEVFQRLKNDNQLIFPSNTINSRRQSNESVHSTGSNKSSQSLKKSLPSPAKPLQKSSSAILTGLSPSKRSYSVSSLPSQFTLSPQKLLMKSGKTFTSQTAILEFDENSENENLVKDCDCLVVTNSNLNLQNNTPLILRYAPIIITSPYFFTISQHQIQWEHKGSDVLQVRIHKRKDLQLSPNSFFHMKMDVKNLTNRPLRLTCKMPRKISSGEQNDSHSKVVAICKQSFLELGNVNSHEEVQTSFDYYILSEGCFKLNRLEFIENSGGESHLKTILVDINIFELVK